MKSASRKALLATPTLDLEELARVRGATADDAESWVRRHAEHLLSVTQLGRVVFPAFQFDDGGELRDHIRRINVLLNADPTMDPWSRWQWWWSRTSYLSGQSPLDIIDSDYERVLRAAHRMTRQPRAAQDDRILSTQGPADELDELVEWTATQPDLLSPDERRARIDATADEIVSKWGDVLRRLRDE